MSNTVHAIVKHRVLGLKGGAKGVALYLADLASDDGSGIWAAKGTMADQLEVSRNTVLAAIKALLSAGFLTEDGTRKCTNGATICYRLNVDLIRSLPCTCGGKGCNFCTGAKSEPLQNLQGRGAKSEPHGVQNLHPNHPLTIQEPSKGAADLFSSDETDQQAPPVDDLDRKAQAFWDEYPKNSRKANEKGVKEKFKAIVAGKVKSVNHASADRILAGLRGFKNTNPDLQFVPAPMRWLNDARWEAFDTPKPTDPNGPRSSFMQKSGW